MVGEVIASVAYADLDFLEPEYWDCGEFHILDVGIQFTTKSGRIFSVSWSCWDAIEAIEIVESDIGYFHTPARDDPDYDGLWVVNKHDLWQSFIGSRIESCTLIPMLYEGFILDPEFTVPIGVRIAANDRAVWLISAKLIDSKKKPTLGEIRIGSDSLVVLFSDEAGEKVGLKLEGPNVVNCPYG